MSDVLRRVVIVGKVQGVGFRYWTQITAQRLGLRGWVRNRRDGSVEAVFAGAPDIVAAMIGECRRGPSAARVDRVDDFDAGVDELGDVSGRFENRPTF